MCDHKFVITAFLQYYCLPGYNLTTVSGKVTTVTPELFQAVLVLFVEETRSSLTFSSVKDHLLAHKGLERQAERN